MTSIPSFSISLILKASWLQPLLCSGLYPVVTHLSRAAVHKLHPGLQLGPNSPNQTQRITFHVLEIYICWRYYCAVFAVFKLTWHCWLADCLPRPAAVPFLRWVRLVFSAYMQYLGLCHTGKIQCISRSYIQFPKIIFNSKPCPPTYCSFLSAQCHQQGNKHQSKGLKILNPNLCRMQPNTSFCFKSNNCFLNMIFQLFQF